MSEAFVYIMTNKPHGTLYIGVTSDIARRVEQHRLGKGKSYTARYNLHRLVFLERHDRIETAIQRETSLKRWPRKWKTDLIAAANPRWDDLLAVHL